MKRTAKAGQLVRFIDIPTGTNIIEGVESPKQLADMLKHNCAQYFGTAGPAFVEALISNYKSAIGVRDEVSKICADASTRLTPVPLPPELERATDRFALVEAAGTLAVKCGILPLTVEEVQRAVAVVYSAWFQEASSIPDSVRAISYVQDFILKNREGRIRKSNHDLTESPGSIRDLAGYWDLTNNLYLLTSEGFKESCKGQDPKVVAAELDKHSLLFKNEAQRYQSKHSIPGDREQTRFYAIREKILSWSAPIPSIPRA